MEVDEYFVRLAESRMKFYRILRLSEHGASYPGKILRGLYLLTMLALFQLARNIINHICNSAVSGNLKFFKCVSAKMFQNVATTFAKYTLMNASPCKLANLVSVVDQYCVKFHFLLLRNLAESQH